MVSQDLRVPVLLLDEASGEEAHDRGEEGETAPHRRHEELTDEIFGHLRPPRHTTSSSDSSTGDSKTKPMRGSSSRSLSASWLRSSCTSARRASISLRMRRKNTVTLLERHHGPSPVSGGATLLAGSSSPARRSGGQSFSRLASSKFKAIHAIRPMTATTTGI